MMSVATLACIWAIPHNLLLCAYLLIQYFFEFYLHLEIYLHLVKVIEAGAKKADLAHTVVVQKHFLLKLNQLAKAIVFFDYTHSTSIQLINAQGIICQLLS